MGYVDLNSDSAIDDIASGLSSMAASALASGIEPFQLRRVLRFVGQVVQVVDESFANVYGILIELRHLSPEDLERNRGYELVKDLELTVATSHFRDSLEVCSRLRHLRSQYDASIRPILKEKGLDHEEWSSVFYLIDEYEGAIVTLIEKTVGDITTSLRQVQRSSLPGLNRLASERAELLRKGLGRLRDLEGRIMGISGDEGLLELSADGKQPIAQVVFQPQFDQRFSDHRKGKFMGDTFSNIGPNTTIINRSLVQHSMNRARANGGGDVADALKKIADAVDASGNKEAVEFFDQFNEELQKPEPRKTLLRSSWDNLVNALPTIGALAGAAEAIAKLFS
jgi:hypothetical protein